MTFALLLSFVVSIGSAMATDIPSDLLTGLYSDDFDSGPDLVGVGSAAGQKVTFGGTFHDVAETGGFDFDPNDPNDWSNTREILEGVWAAEATPFANVRVAGSAASIANGAHDAEIAEWVRHVKSYLDLGGSRSLIVAPLQEHNGDWTTYGCDPDSFKQAYARFVGAFRDAGIDETRVRFAWAPNGWTPPACGSLADYYPGDALVDIVAISAYNFGTCVSGGTYETPEEVFDPYLSEIRNTIPGTVTKPFLVAQTASPRPACGGNQSEWVSTMIGHLADDPNVVGFVWFNFDKETDFRIWTGALAQGWQDGVAAGHTSYRWPLTDWFASGPLILGEPGPEEVPCREGPCDAIVTVDSGGLWSLWASLKKAPQVSSFYFGVPGDIPFMGDWDGDSVGTPGLYRQSDGFVYLRHSNTQGMADTDFYFGVAGDLPLVGDFNGDGRDTVSIWRASEARVYIMNELGADGGGLGAADYSFEFGNPGDQPFVGDFDGDGIDSVGLYRQTSGFVYFRNSLTTGVADLAFFYGDSGDSILAGDWDGDGDDTVAVYRPSTRRLYVNLENTNGAADWNGYVGSFAHVLVAPIG